MKLILQRDRELALNCRSKGIAQSIELSDGEVQLCMDRFKTSGASLLMQNRISTLPEEDCIILHRPNHYCQFLVA
jgi:hypothetical protein